MTKKNAQSILPLIERNYKNSYLLSLKFNEVVVVVKKNNILHSS